MASPPFRHITIDALAKRLRQRPTPLLLDVRRSDALRKDPRGLPGAIPLLLDEAEVLLPDLPRDRPIVAYCLCRGQASSTRAALWLTAAGYTDVAILDGGLPAWRAAGLPLEGIDVSRRDLLPGWMPRVATGTPAYDPERPMAELSFLPGESLPLRRRFAILFIDIVDSTRMVASLPPEQVLLRVQRVMHIVVELAVQHCGDVHDFQGDGAMLYFAGVGEAAPAAFAMRKALLDESLPDLRLAMDVGELVVGHVGTHDRRHLAMIGAAVNRAARLQALAPVNGIAITQAVMDELQQTAPALARRFTAHPKPELLRGFERATHIHLSPPDQA